MVRIRIFLTFFAFVLTWCLTSTAYAQSSEAPKRGATSEGEVAQRGRGGRSGGGGGIARPSRSAPAQTRSAPARSVPAQTRSAPARSAPARSAPAQTRSAPARSAPAHVNRQPSRPGPAQVNRQPSRPGPAQVNRQPSRPGPAHVNRQPSRPGPAQVNRQPSRPGPAHVNRQPSRPGPAQNPNRNIRPVQAEARGTNRAPQWDTRGQRGERSVSPNRNTRPVQAEARGTNRAPQWDTRGQRGERSVSPNRNTRPVQADARGTNKSPQWEPRGQRGERSVSPNRNTRPVQADARGTNKSPQWETRGQRSVSSGERQRRTFNDRPTRAHRGEASNGSRTFTRNTSGHQAAPVLSNETRTDSRGGTRHGSGIAYPVRPPVPATQIVSNSQNVYVNNHSSSQYYAAAQPRYRQGRRGWTQGHGNSHHGGSHISINNNINTCPIPMAGYGYYGVMPVYSNWWNGLGGMGLGGWGMGLGMGMGMGGWGMGMGHYSIYDGFGVSRGFSHRNQSTFDPYSFYGEQATYYPAPEVGGQMAAVDGAEQQLAAAPAGRAYREDASTSEMTFGRLEEEILAGVSEYVGLRTVDDKFLLPDPAFENQIWSLGLVQAPVIFTIDDNTYSVVAGFEGVLGDSTIPSNVGVEFFVNRTPEGWNVADAWIVSANGIFREKLFQSPVYPDIQTWHSGTNCPFSGQPLVPISEGGQHG